MAIVISGGEQKDRNTTEPTALRRHGFFPGPASPTDTDTIPQRRARIEATLGTSHGERIYSETTFGKVISTACIAEIVAISYKQDPVQVAEGNFDTKFVNEFSALAARTGQTFYVSYDHEVDNKVKSGVYTAANYKAAALHFTDLARSVGGTNIKVGVCYMSWSLTQPTSNDWHPDNLYIGASNVDLIAFDAYWRTSMATADDVYGGAVNWAAQHNKPLGIWETSFGNHGNTGTDFTDAQWQTMTGQVIDYWAAKDINHVLWFESSKSDGDWRILPHASSSSQFAAEMARLG